MKHALPLLLTLALLTGCMTTPPVHSTGGDATLRVSSDPEGAYILVSKDREGPWEFYRKEEGLHVTPSASALGAGDFFWLKVQREGYREPDPAFIRVSDGETIDQQFTLEPANRAMLYVDSEPEGAEVLVAESLDGDYQPWEGAMGQPITPARGEVSVGDTFWMKVSMKGRLDPNPEPVHVQDTSPIHLTFKPGRKPAETQQLSVTSHPQGATVLVAAAENGDYQPWPPEEQLQATPLSVNVDVGQAFWLKLRMDGYWTTRPELVRVTSASPVTIEKTLKPMGEQAPQTGPPAVDPQGHVTAGYAIIEGNPGEARRAAILDALSAAVQAQYGTRLQSTSLAENYALVRHAVQAAEQGEVASYEILEESQENGLYRVKLRVLFKEDLMRQVSRANLTFFVAGKEFMVINGQEVSSDLATGAAADTLMNAGTRVHLADGPVTGLADVPGLARKAQADLALYVVGGAKVHDRFGDFHAYKADLRYRLVQPGAGSLTSEGTAQVIGERKLDAQEAARDALRAAGEAVAEEALTKLAARFDRAASYTVYVLDLQDPRQAEAITTELRSLDWVRDARLLAVEEGICEVLLTLAAEGRPHMASVLQRVRNVDLELAEADLYTAVMRVR